MRERREEKEEKFESYSEIKSKSEEQIDSKILKRKIVQLNCKHS